MTPLISIQENTNLTSLGLSALESVDYDFSVKANTQLCTNMVEQLANEISVGGEIVIAGNQVCP
ncbi:MAG: hypothetical protein KJ737_05035 [Proteobacteria bacterium]|nr:hypothetical protein [Pseudomonadota bacterium]